MHSQNKMNDKIMHHVEILVVTKHPLHKQTIDMVCVFIFFVIIVHALTNPCFN